MRIQRTGQLAHDPSIARTLAEDRLTEAYLQATAPKAYAYAGGRMLYDRAPVKVTHICMRERRFRFAQVTAYYTV